MKVDLSDYKIRELYTRAVGEIGIQPSDFLNMTEEEIDLAYQGYLRRIETQANLTMIAVKKALQGQTKLIRLTEDSGYTVGNIRERENTFKLLHINEE